MAGSDGGQEAEARAGRWGRRQGRRRLVAMLEVVNFADEPVDVTLVILNPAAIR